MDEWLKFSLTSIISFLLGGGAVSAYISLKNSQREAKTQKEIVKVTIATDLLHEQLDRINKIKLELKELIHKRQPDLLHYISSEPIDFDKKSMLLNFFENDYIWFTKIYSLYAEIRPYLREENLSKCYFKQREDGKNEIVVFFTPHTKLIEKYKKWSSNIYTSKTIPGIKDTIFEGYKLDILNDIIESAHTKGRNHFIDFGKLYKNEFMVELSKISVELHKKIVKIALDYAQSTGDFKREFLKTMEKERELIISELHDLDV